MKSFEFGGQLLLIGQIIDTGWWGKRKILELNSDNILITHKINDITDRLCYTERMFAYHCFMNWCELDNMQQYLIHPYETFIEVGA